MKWFKFHSNPTPTATPIKAQEATAPAINLNPINNNDMKFVKFIALYLHRRNNRNGSHRGGR